MMKSVVVYFSKFGNTRKVAQVVAESLGAHGQVAIIPVEALNTLDPGAFDLLVMGVPTHNMNLPKSVRPILKTLPKRIFRGVQMAAFDTSYEMNWFLNLFTAAKKLQQALRKKGGRLVVPPKTFIVSGREGPLVEGEIERAHSWAQSILAAAV
jgi:flavodoxin